MPNSLTFALCLLVLSIAGCDSATVKEDSRRSSTSFALAWMTTASPDVYYFVVNAENMSLEGLTEKISTHKESRLSKPIRVDIGPEKRDRVATFDLDVSGTWLDLLASVADKYDCVLREKETEFLIQDASE